MGLLGDFEWSNPGDYFDRGVSIAKMAIWADDPLTQIVTNAVIIVALMLASSVGFLVGIPIALVAVMLLLVGVVRLIWEWLAG